MAYICSISNHLSIHPVVSSVSGHIFEKAVIEEYVKKHGRDPMNGEVLKSENLIVLKGQYHPSPSQKCENVTTTTTTTSTSASLKQIEDEYARLIANRVTLQQNLHEANENFKYSLVLFATACFQIWILKRQNSVYSFVLSAIYIRQQALLKRNDFQNIRQSAENSLIPYSSQVGALQTFSLDGNLISFLSSVDTEVFVSSHEPSPIELQGTLALGNSSIIPYLDSSYRDMMDILKESGYNLTLTAEERRYGPPSGGKSLPSSKRCKIILKNVPANIYENSIIRIFNLQYGSDCKINELILRMDPASSSHVGLAIITFADKKIAKHVYRNASLIKRKIPGIDLIWYSKAEITQLMNEKHTCGIVTMDSIVDCYLCPCFSYQVDAVRTLLNEIKGLKQLLLENNLKPIIDFADSENISRYAFHSFSVGSRSSEEDKNLKRLMTGSRVTVASGKIFLSENILKNTHRYIMPQNLGGELRRVNVESSTIYNCRFYPTLVDELKPDIEAFINLTNQLSESEDDVGVLGATVIMLVALDLSAFPDGNRKLSRLLFNWFLKSKDNSYPWIAFPMKEKLKYSAMLHIAQSVERNMTPLLNYTASVIQKSLKSYLNDLRSEFQRHTES